MSSRYLIILVLFLCRVSFSQWFPQQAGTNYELKSVHFTDQNTGYICGYNLILKTTNGGLNWNNSFLQGKHNSIVFQNNLTGYVSSDSGKIYKTTNSGLNWTIQNSGTIKNLTSITFLNSETGIVTGYGKTLLKTTNGGNNWFSIANIIWEIDFLASKIISENSYFVTGTDSHIIRTTNGGNNWITFTMGEVNPLFTVEFINNNTGFATGCCGMFLSTTNGGINWIENHYLSLGFTFRSLKFTDDNTGFCAGDNGMIFRSTNRGVNWDSTVTGTNQILYDIFMFNNNTGWAVGNYGTILKSTNGGGAGYPIGIEPVSNELPKEFSLHQNYPNPFNPVTKIRFAIPSNVKSAFGGQTSNVKIIIFDVLGREVETLVNEQLKPGTYEIDWSSEGGATHYSSGIYYYILQSGGYSESRKMVLIK